MLGLGYRDTYKEVRTREMKLGSNRKAVGMGADFREYSPDNTRVRDSLDKREWKTHD